MLHNLLNTHSAPQDSFDSNVLELDQEDELNEPIDQSDADTRCNQIFA